MAKRRGRDGYPKGRAPKRARLRQPALPGTDDSAIKELEEAAFAYAETRDERMTLTESEAQQKRDLTTLMQQHGKKVYHRGRVTITLTTKEESVKVRVAKPGEQPRETSEPVHDHEDAGEQTVAGPMAGEPLRPGVLAEH